MKFKTQMSQKKHDFNYNGLIYQNYVALGKTITVAYSINTMRTFMNHFNSKRLSMAKGEWHLHLNKASSHTAKVTKEFMATMSISVIEYPPYSPNLVPQTSFSCPWQRRPWGHQHHWQHGQNVSCEGFL